MRLTKKETNSIGIETGFYTIKVNTTNRYIKDEIGNLHQINNSFLSTEKLGRLEDAEDMLGIDLILLPILLNIKQGDKIYVIDETLVEAEVTDNSLINGKLMVFSRYGYNGMTYTPVCYYSEYGKTWALTKEELL